MKLIVVGMNHSTAPVEIRERYAVAQAKIPEYLNQLTGKPPLKEAVIVSTCNRVEIYALSMDAEEGIKHIHGFFQNFQPQLPLNNKYFYIYESEHTVQHLFEVASGLNSMVVGETEVTGQVKEAYRIASDAGSTGPALNKLFQKSFEVAKMIRSTTKIGEGSVSVGSVAADLAVQIFGNLHDKKVLLLGAGNMSATTARALNARGCKSIIVSNRFHERAAHLAAELGGQAAHFEDWPKHFLDVDIMISSTAAPHPIVPREVLEVLVKERQYKPVFLIDIAVPRDIERSAGDLENVYLYDIDDLKVISEQNMALRHQELISCKDKINGATGKFIEWFGRHHDRWKTVPHQLGVFNNGLNPLST
jgi:glutamyl-tRNA reductase